MTGHLGLAVGNARSAAAHRISPDAEPAVISLATTLRFDDDGRAHLGEDAGPDHFTHFVDAVGDASRTGSVRAEDLVANAANCLRSLVTDIYDGSAPITTLTYPAAWSSADAALLRDALDHIGLTDVEIVPDASAADAGDVTAAALAALAVSERRGHVGNDSADTDALPIVAAPAALAFSEAIPVAFGPSAYAASSDAAVADTPARRRMPVVIAGIAALVVVVGAVGVGFATGSFGGSDDVDAPAITDAQTAAETTAPIATTTAASLPMTTVPFPTTEAPAPPPIVEPVVPEPAAPESALPEPPVPEPVPVTEEPEPTIVTPTLPTLPPRTIPTLPGIPRITGLPALPTNPFTGR